MPVSAYWVSGMFLPKTFFRLGGPGDNLAFAHLLVLPVVQFQSVEVPVAAENLVVHHAPEVQVDSLVGVGRHVAAVVCQQETDTRVEILVSVGITSGRLIAFVVYQSLGRLGEVVVVDVNLRAGKEVAVAQAEQKPGVDLYAAVAVSAGRIASDVVPVGGISDVIIILHRILIAEFSEDAETVVLEEQLGLGENVDSTVEHECQGRRHHRASQCRVLGSHAEGHQGASANQQAEVGRIAGTAQDVIMKIPIGFLQLFQLLFSQNGRAVVGNGSFLLLGLQAGHHQCKYEQNECKFLHMVGNVVQRY